MADTYYSHEDTPPPAAETAVDLWKQQSEPLAAYVHTAETIAAEVETALTARYELAEAAGDEASKSEIVVTYNHVQTLKSIIHHQDAANVGAGVAIELLVEQIGQATGELQDIMQAIENQDEQHPAVGELIEIVREDERENLDDYVQEAVWNVEGEIADAAHDEAREALMETGVEQLTAYFGLSPQTAKRFMQCFAEYCPLVATARLIEPGSRGYDFWGKYAAWYAANKTALQAIGDAIEAALGEQSAYTGIERE